MTKRIEIVDAEEDEILRFLDDGLFFAELSREAVVEYAGVEPLGGVDELVHNALRRALIIQVPDGRSGILTAKGRQK